MTLVDDARKVQKQWQIENATKKRQKHPTGFEPGLNTEAGTIVGVFEEPLEKTERYGAFQTLLASQGVDLEEFTIEDDRLEVRTWQGLSNIDGPYHGRIIQLFYYKAKLIRRRPEADVSDLVKVIRARKPLKPKKTVAGDRAFVVLNADWQLGKRDGEGTAYTIERLLETIPQIKKRYQELRKAGHKFDQLVILNLGDLIEGCVGFYPMQTFNVELSQREQVRLGRELLTKQIMAWADDFESVLVATVAGNHGENRNEDGKTFTNLGDNDDVALVEQVAEAFELAKTAGATRYGHVTFRIPDNQLSFTIDLHGTIVGVTHGHVGNARKQSGRNLAHTKLWDWWYGQQMGRQPVADADILISGHYHYLSVIMQGGRTALQATPLEPGSEWFTDAQGLESPAAVTTLLIGGGVSKVYPGWEALEII